MYFKTKNICFFNSCKNWGGGEKWHFEMANIFRQRGYNVIMVTNAGSDLSAKIRTTQIPSYLVKIGNLSFFNLFKIYKIRKILKENQIDAIIFGLPSDVKTGGFAAKLAKVNKIVYRRGTALPVKNSLLNQFIFKHIITDVITNSIEIKNKFLECNPLLFPTENIHIIYNGISVNGFVQDPLPNVPLKQIVIGNAGRLVEQKGQKYIIELASVLKKKGLDFKIKIAGKGKLKAVLEKLAHRFNVNENIEFLNFVDDIDQFYKSIDIYILSSIHEGSAHTIIEAMYYAKPIIAFNVSSMPEIITHEQTGFLVELGNVTQIAEKVIFLANNPHLINELGEAARKKIITHYNINNTVKQLESIL